MTVEVAMSAASFVATERSAKRVLGVRGVVAMGWVLLGRGDASVGPSGVDNVPSTVTVGT
ncbi:hypothetical protein GCM10027519_14260 [Kineococcus endophyticus]